MPKVASFAVDGIDLWFNSNDHLPPHFHAERPWEWEVRVFFLREVNEMTQLVYSKRPLRPRRSELKNLLQLAESFRVQLLEQWEAVVDVKAPGADR